MRTVTRILRTLPIALALGAQLSALAGQDPPVVRDPGTTHSTPSDDMPLDQGVWLALTGRLAEAESLFVVQLGDAASRPAARNNLGNIHLLNGRLDLALALYDAVLEQEPDEAGTILNRALLKQLAGDTLGAWDDAGRGVALAGGEAEAAWLLGVRHQADAPGDRGAAPVRISPAQVRELLALARRAVPADTARVEPLRPTIPPPGSAPALGPAHRPKLATSGARAGAEESRVLYWKFRGGQ